MDYAPGELFVGISMLGDEAKFELSLAYFCDFLCSPVQGSTKPIVLHTNIPNQMVANDEHRTCLRFYEPLILRVHTNWYFIHIRYVADVKGI